MNALTLRGVTKRFGGLTAVRDVHLDIAHGQKWALIGPNGAGKTTLFNVIAGDLPATAGRIELFGTDITHMAVHKRVKLGLRRTYQTSALFNNLTVTQNLYLGVLGPETGHLAMMRRFDGDTARMKRVEELARTIGLAERMNVYAGELSHGERRQLEFGLAVASNPRFVMLDEPAAGLSPDERKIIGAMLTTLGASITLLLIEHDMDVALSIAEYVAVLHEGQIIATGTPREIVADEQVQRVYLGASTHE